VGLFEDSIRRLIEGPRYDVVLYLDERGTPATDRRLVTGGVLVYNNPQDVAVHWRQYWEHAGLRQKKGRDLDQHELLAVAEFLIMQPVLPVVAWSMLEQEELSRLRRFSQKYEKSQSPLKRFKKISGASWLWKHQMNQTVACAQAAFIGCMGPIRSATVYIDKMNEEPEKREHYRQLLTLHAALDIRTA
jgi:hypothetical protein